MRNVYVHSISASALQIAYHFGVVQKLEANADFKHAPPLMRTILNKVGAKHLRVKQMLENMGGLHAKAPPRPSKSPADVGALVNPLLVPSHVPSHVATNERQSSKPLQILGQLKRLSSGNSGKFLVIPADPLRSLQMSLSLSH